jgi:hypothetical protein
MTLHPSNSTVQVAIESECLELVGQELDARLIPEVLKLVDGTEFQVDGVDKAKRVLCEVFSHIGPLKDGQRKKLAKDILRLLVAEHSLQGDWRKVICVVDDPAYRYLTKTSWCSVAAKEFGFQVLKVMPDPKSRLRLNEAQVRQASGISLQSDR